MTTRIDWLRVAGVTGAALFLGLYFAMLAYYDLLAQVNR